MKRRLLALLATTSAIALAAGGCGGDDEDPVAAGGLEKAAFLERANAACRQEQDGLMDRVSAFERNRGGRRPRPYADMVHFVFLPTVEAEVSRLERLPAPAGEGERIDSLLNAQRAALDAVAVKPRVASIAAAERYFAKPGRELRAYGLGACAHDSRPRS